MVKKFYSESEVLAAKNVNLIDFIKSRYPDEIFYNRQKGRWCRNDSHYIVILTERQRYKTRPFLTWSDFTLGDENNSADNIEYLKRFHNMGFKEAVSELLSYEGKSDQELNKNLSDYHNKLSNSKKPISESKRPSLNYEYLNQIRDYLNKIRKIDLNLINTCIERGLIYPASMPGTDKGICFYNPMSKFFIFREIYKSDSKKRNSSGSDYWIFSTSEEIKTIYITEAPIDALSLCELLKFPSDSAFISMGGLKTSTVEKVISDFPDSKIYISVDWDEPGKTFYNTNFKEKLNFFHPSDKYMSITKDWNDFLRVYKASKTV